MAKRIRGFIPLPKGICPKVNVIARLEFKLDYFDSTGQRFNHYTTMTSLKPTCLLLLKCARSSLNLHYLWLCTRLSKWLVGFNCISTRLDLFYAKRLQNHYMFIFTFVIYLSLKSFLHIVIWYKVFQLNKNNLHLVVWLHGFLSIN